MFQPISKLEAGKIGHVFLADCQMQDKDSALQVVISTIDRQTWEA